MSCGCLRRSHVYDGIRLQIREEQEFFANAVEAVSKCFESIGRAAKSEGKDGYCELHRVQHARDTLESVRSSAL